MCSDVWIGRGHTIHAPSKNGENTKPIRLLWVMGGRRAGGGVGQVPSSVSETHSTVHDSGLRTIGQTWYILESWVILVWYAQDLKLNIRSLRID